LDGGVGGRLGSWSLGGGVSDSFNGNLGGYGRIHWIPCSQVVEGGGSERVEFGFSHWGSDLIALEP
jgi:hypothetical protein